MVDKNVIQTGRKTVELTDDEMQDVVFAMIYHKYFHHRTPGASKMVLIAKLGECCGIKISPEIEETFKLMMEQGEPYAILDENK